MKPARYTSNLQKGGALLDVTARLVSAWDSQVSAAGNLAAIQDTNVLGAASAVRRWDLVERILRPRFVDPGPHVISALQVLLRADRLAFRDACYFETSRTEPLLAEFAQGPLFDGHASGRSTVSVEDAETWLRHLTVTGATPDWSDAVRTRVARALLAALRDFGVLSGTPSSPRKEIGHPYPSAAGFTYACWRLLELGATAASIEASPVWRRWLLTPDDARSLMADLASHGVIMLNRAGSVTRIEWRAATLVEAVHAAA
ncbi:MAG: BrxA family protein [Acidimicrobiales bacterium]